MSRNVERLKPFINGNFITSKTQKYMPVYDPSTGSIIAETPCCTLEEVDDAIISARNAYPGWSSMTPHKRAQLFFNLRNLMREHLDELTLSVATENGKNWSESKGDVTKAIEMVEIACNIPTLLMGESLMDCSSGYDTTLYREPMGVFVGIAPFNFPAMIPMGWMAPLAIACGNTYVIKAASMTPITSLKIAALYKEAGFPDGVINVVTCSRVEAERFISHPAVRGITLVGSTATGRYIYGKAAENGKRVQALTEAKNHALVMKDAPLQRTVAGIINSAFGCAGERCMALSVVCVEEEIADSLVEELKRQLSMRNVGPAYNKNTNLGPVVTAEHKQSILNWIQKGLDEGAVLALDGREIVVPGYEKGFYLGPTILDHVKPGMTVGDKEIFGPVLCIKRVKDFEEGLSVMNSNEFANGSCIFTQNGYFAREFCRRTDGGMVGVNVGIPVPVGIFPFCGHKNSFFGDLHAHGKDFVRFFTESKTVTTHWYDEDEKKNTNVNTWDGSMAN